MEPTEGRDVNASEFSLVDHTRSMDPSIVAALDRGSIGLVAAYSLPHPNLSSVVFGSTSPGQLAENVATHETFLTLTPAERAELTELATTA